MRALPARRVAVALVGPDRGERLAALWRRARPRRVVHTTRIESSLMAALRGAHHAAIAVVATEEEYVASAPVTAAVPPACTVRLRDAVLAGAAVVTLDDDDADDLRTTLGAGDARLAA